MFIVYYETNIHMPVSLGSILTTKNEHIYIYEGDKNLNVQHQIT
jgi:hypothetical protein